MSKIKTFFNDHKKELIYVGGSVLILATAGTAAFFLTKKRNAEILEDIESEEIETEVESNE